MSLIKMTKWIGIMNVVRLLYEQFLRAALLEYVKSTENDWDDNIVVLVDAVMYADYDTPKGGV